MDSKKYVDKITLEYLSRSRSNINNSDELSLKKDDIHFYKKRIINTSRELIKKIIDISFNHHDNNIINNTTVEEAFMNYINTLIYAYKQDDIKDMINNNNGHIDISNSITSGESISDDLRLTSDSIHTIDNNLFRRPSNIKNKYDWSQYCKIEKKDIEKEYHIPKIKEYNLKDPILRTKGIKNKKSNDNIVK